jgi:hypothetical protein
LEVGAATSPRHGILTDDGNLARLRRLGMAKSQKGDGNSRNVEVEPHVDDKGDGDD